MRRTLTLLMPALIPSWRFFRTVGPSPRIERIAADGTATDLMPQPAKLTVMQHLLRLVWNPAWNAHLYRVTCAERLVATGSPHATAQLQSTAGATFQIAFVYRDGTHIRRIIAYPDPAHDD